MGTPTIAKNSPVAKQLATTLGTTVEKLSVKGRVPGDAGIFIGNLEGKRVIRLDGGDKCGWVSVVVDNGDGKIGNGDLYMQGYKPGFDADGKTNFRYAVMGQSANAQSNYDLTEEGRAVFQRITGQSGQAFNTTVFGKICR